MMRRLFFAIAMLAVVALAIPPAHGQTDRQRQAAELAEVASEAFEAGDLDRAIEAYLEAFALVPDPSFAFNLGVLYDDAGDLPRAYRYFSQYLDLFPGAEDRGEIEAYLEELLADLRRGYTEVTVQATPREAEVWLMGASGEELLGESPVAAWIAPGSITIEVRADGYVTVTERYNGVAGVRVPIEIALELEQTSEQDPTTVTVVEDPTDIPTTPTETEPRTRSGGGANGAGIGLTAGGGALIAGGVVMMVMGRSAASNHNDLVATIGGPGDADFTPDDFANRAQDIDDYASKASTFSTLGVVGLGVGVAVAGVGIYMLTRGGGDRQSAATPTSWGVAPTPGGWSAGAMWRF